MEGNSAENSCVEEKPAPSVAKLAGIFGDQKNCTKNQTPPYKPTRRKPPCSLPLHAHKPEVTHQDDGKVSPQVPQLPKVKVKSSPLIEKLQANLVFPPAALLPGGSPKSPGLKVMASPFNSPPSTPNSPGIQSRSSESDEVPTSFEQPPEGAPLTSYTKVRTKGSIKRRPPSRRFRKSQSDIGYEDDVGFIIRPNENGETAEEGDDIFQSKEKEKIQKPESTEKTNKTPLESTERSLESARNDEEKSNEKDSLKEISNDSNIIKDKVEGPGCELKEEKDKQKGDLTSGERDTQEETHELNVTINTETANTKQSELPDREVNNEQDECGEDKTDAEK
ncbi:capZ-interacting protein [Bombina bombina]|uniref:capZ-interacting protein n=1 Tax=Bombina bombina TaxID=8345 RepID=UPI00235A938D|nr:capZ-interacting protein [Bombina bombina]